MSEALATSAAASPRQPATVSWTAFCVRQGIFEMILGARFIDLTPVKASGSTMSLCHGMLAGRSGDNGHMGGRARQCEERLRWAANGHRKTEIIPKLRELLAKRGDDAGTLVALPLETDREPEWEPLLELGDMALAFDVSPLFDMIEAVGDFTDGGTGAPRTAAAGATRLAGSPRRLR